MRPRIASKNNMLAGKAGQRGFTLFELAVVASVIAVLAVVLLGRLEGVQQEAERVAVQQTSAGTVCVRPAKPVAGAGGAKSHRLAG